MMGIKQRFWIGFLGSLTVIFSCHRISNDEHRGEIVLSSAFNFTNNTINGFNFELNAFTSFPDGDPLPDIIVDKYTRVDGTILPGFTSPGNDEGFALAGELETLSESTLFFEDYEEFDPLQPLSPTTDTVKLYQVWILKTVNQNFVKLHVTDIQSLKNASGDYLEITLDYYYQDDGTPLFPK